MLIATAILQLPSLAIAECVRERKRKAIASGSRERPYLGQGEEYS